MSLLTTDFVYAQWNGGTITGTEDDSYLSPLYYPAKVQEILQHGLFQVEFCQQQKDNKHWTAIVPCQNIQSSLVVNNWINIPNAFRKAQEDMSNQLMWMDWSVAEGTELWHDGKKVTVVHFTKIYWKGVMRELRRKGSNVQGGGYIPVVCHEDKSHTLLLCQNCLGDKSHTISNVTPILPSSPHEAMLWSLESSGKTMVTVAGGQALQGYWTVDDTWYAAKSFDGSLEDMSIQSLANHMTFHEAGKYCLVRWDGDKSVSIVPFASLRLRGRSTNATVKLVE